MVCGTASTERDGRLGELKEFRVAVERRCLAQPCLEVDRMRLERGGTESPHQGQSKMGLLCLLG